jgi:cobalt/nickel transport system permease protein
MLLPGHIHRPRSSGIPRWPAEWKFAGALVILLGTVVQSELTPLWFGPVWGLLIWVWWRSRLPVGFVMSRLLWLSPFVLAVALAGAWRPVGGPAWWVLACKAFTSLLTVVLLANTTPFSEMLRVFRRLRVPGLLLSTLALMHRYVFVLLEETERMRRARAGRTFRPGRSRLWQIQASVVGHLLIRALARASRIYQAMLARGWS